MTPRACLWTLLVLHYMCEHFMFFVHLLLLIKLLSILHSNALLVRLVYVWCTLELVGGHGPTSVSATAVKVVPFPQSLLHYLLQVFRRLRQLNVS